MADQDSTGVPADTAVPSPDMAQQRKQWLRILAVVVIVSLVVFGLYRWIAGGRYVSTENAYVNADMAQITPLVSGAVAEVRVVDTQAVKRGDILVVIDPADARIALAQAEAELARAERTVRQTLATGGALDAQVEARSANMARAQAALTSAKAELEKARVDLERREALISSGAVSGDELTAVRTRFSAARAAQAAAEAQVAEASSDQQTAKGNAAANAALVTGTSVQNHPDVQAARARRDQARLELQRTVMRAPFDGVVTRRQVQVGQRVAPGAPLMVIVPIGQVYVDANFKEVELTNVRPGQPVELTSDLYGNGVVYHGHVTGLSGGTGSAFAVIPAQNATGNWIKVVQRLPVRIALDPRELREHPLRVGLSMEVTIDTRPH